jgi:hypothetical protein
LTHTGQKHAAASDISSVHPARPADTRIISQSSIHSLPYELSKLLLMRSARLLSKSLLTTESLADAETFVTLASVCQHFYKILTAQKRFARTFQQYLIGVVKVAVYEREWPVMEIHSLPYELHEQLLMRSACLLAKTLLTTESRPDVQTFVTLASVCQHFHSILTLRKWFACAFQQYITVVCRPYRPRPSLLATFDDGPVRESEGESVRSQVLGLTTLDNKLFVVYFESATIYVYTRHSPYTQLTNIHVNGLKQPTDIAACSINSCLYVPDMVVNVSGR